MMTTITAAEEGEAGAHVVSLVVFYKLCGNRL